MIVKFVRELYNQLNTNPKEIRLARFGKADGAPQQ